MSNIQQRKVYEAASQFVQVWADLGPALPDDYGCHLTCSEADTLAELFRAFGDDDSANHLIERHADLEEEPETCSHHPGVGFSETV